MPICENKLVNLKFGDFYEEINIWVINNWFAS